MVHIATVGLEDAEGREIGLRMRGAQLESVPGGAVAPEPDTVDAVAFLGPACPAEEVIARFLAAARPVLVAVSSAVPRDRFEGWLAAAQDAKSSLAVWNRDR